MSPINTNISMKRKSFHGTLKFPTITKSSDAAKAVLRLLIEGEDEDEDERNQVLKTLRKDQIARNLLFFGPPLLAGIITVLQHLSSAPLLNHFAVSLCLMSVSIAMAFIFVGLLYRRVRRRLSIALELAGITLMLLSFFVFLSLYLPASLTWLPILCFSGCLIPLRDAARSIFVKSNPASEDVLNRV